MESTNPRVRRYLIGVSASRLFAQDEAGKAVDIGYIEEKDGVLGYRLNVDDIAVGGFLSSEKLLQDVGAKLAYSHVQRLFAEGRPAGVREDRASLSVELEVEAPGAWPPPGSAAGSPGGEPERMLDRSETGNAAR